MPIQSSFATVADQVASYNKNMVEILSKINSLSTTTDPQVEVRIYDANGVLSNYTLPSFSFLKSEIDRLNNSIVSSPGKITNLGKAPYANPIYSQINSIGRSWIFEYTLSLSKEMLGYVRGKYTTVPIPGAEVTLNQQDLLSAATSEKEALVSRLRDYFDQTSKQSLLERRAAESTARQQEINQVPMTIYIG